MDLTITTLEKVSFSFIMCLSSSLLCLKFSFEAGRGNHFSVKLQVLWGTWDQAVFAMIQLSDRPCYLCLSRSNCDGQEIWPRTAKGVRGDSDCHWPGGWPADWHLSAEHSHSGPEWQQSQVWEPQIRVSVDISSTCCIAEWKHMHID